MSRVSAICLTLGIGLALVALAAAIGTAQLPSLLGPERVQLIYDGDLQSDSGGIKITPWGSGSAKPVYDETYVGPQVLEVTSQGPYQGVVLHLGRPVNLEEFWASPASYVDLRILPAQVPRPKEAPEQTRERRQQRGGVTGGRGGIRGGRGGGAGGGMRGGAGGGMRGGAGGGMRGGRGGRAQGSAPAVASGALPTSTPIGVELTGGMMGGAGGGVRGGMRGGIGGAGGGGRGGVGGGRGRGGARGGTRGGAQRGGRMGQTTTTGPGATPGVKALTLKSLRLVLFTDQGQLIADEVRVAATTKDKRGWFPVSVALSDFQGPRGAKTLHAVGLFAGQADKFYLGQMRLIVDPSPVRVTVKANPGVARTGDLVDFAAELSGAPVDPEVSWNFGDADEGREQAFGSRVKYLYKKPGDYIVTCTIADRAGVRKPVTATTGVHVEEERKPEGEER